MKLFHKLTFMATVLVVVTTVCLAMAFYWTERQSIHQEAERERRVVLQNLVHIAQESLLTNDDLLLVKYTAWLPKWNPALVSASVVSVNGEVLADSQPNRIGKALTEQASAPRQAELLLLSEPVKLGNRWMGTASTGFSERYYTDRIAVRLHQLQKRLAFMVGFVLLFGAAISFGVARSLTRPIDQLAQAAAQVGQGKHAFDLDLVRRRRDELGFLARAFQKMSDALRELDVMKEDFVSAVTHELRSPLGAIESYLNVMQEEGKDTAPSELWTTYLERIRVNTQRLTRFVNDLLDVAAIERGKITLDVQPVNVGALIQDVVTFFAAKAQEKRVQLAVQIPAGLPDASGDADKLRQVLVNLLSNAMKFTPEAGSIRISADVVSARELKVSVKDTGMGIAADDQEKIFNKFEQVRGARQQVKGPKGTGLGLAICRALVELHGGRIGVDSRPGEGSTFYFTLPVVSRPMSRPVPGARGGHA